MIELYKFKENFLIHIKYKYLFYHQNMLVPNVLLVCLLKNQ